MIPEYPEFKPIDIEDRDFIDGRFNARDRCLCEFCFANQFIWRSFDKPLCTIINGNLCILTNPQNEPRYFLEPVGNNNLAETIEICLKHSGRISRVSNGFVSAIEAENLGIRELRDQFDYIYRVENLADMRGRKYDGKRNHIKKMINRNFCYEYMPIGEDDFREILDLFDEWGNFKVDKSGEEEFPGLPIAFQRDALETAVSNFDALRLLGGGIFVGGRLAGFAIGSRLNKNMACLHFSYTRLNADGLPAVLLWEACRNTFSDFEFINLEQDLGIPGLRRMKKSYHPLRLEKKYQIDLIDQRDVMI